MPFFPPQIQNMGTLDVLVYFTFLSFVVVILYFLLGSRKRAHLPPGPRPLPIVGNLFDIPRKDVVKSYAALSEQYGPLYYLNVVGRHVVVINSLDIARDLFDKRSATYSHRPRMVMAKELVGRETLLFMDYGARLKKGRRMTATLLSTRHMEQYWPIQEAETIKFVLNIAQSHGHADALAHCRWAATALIIRLLYGIEVKSEGDELVKLAADFSRLTTEASMPGNWLVDSLPFLRFLPSWLPGAGFKRWARAARARSDEFAAGPYEVVKKQVADGKVVPCWTAEQLLAATGPLSAEDEHDIRTFASSLYSGGSDTSSTAIATFILMMVRNPAVQRKAQDEIDAATNGGRWVPGLRDRARLPYVNCVLKELLRTNAVAPLVPHSLEEDDVYAGYLIPKGTWVMANVWAFMNDPARYPEPHVFRPERFEGAQPQPDPLDVPFGFGRRACPGKHFALSTIWMSVVHLLFACDVLPEKDAHGHEIVPPVEFDDAHVAHPKPFPYRIVERSPGRIALLEHALANLQAA